MRILCLVVLGCVVVGCDDAKADVYARWRPIHVLGKEKTFYSAHNGGAGTAMSRSYFADVGGWGEARGLNDMLWFNHYRKPEQRFENGTYWTSVNGKNVKAHNKMPYTVWETMGPDVPYNKSRENLKKLHASRPDVPFVLTGFLDSWFPWFMKDKYDCDVQSWMDFIKTYTNCVAIKTLNESDGGFGHFSTKGITNLQMKAEMEAAFPPAKEYRDRVNWLKKTMERQKAMYFGTDRFYSLYSGNLKWGHALAKYGISMLGYECESQVLSGPWRYSMAHIRGVGRQYQIPWTWYAAHLITSLPRDGQGKLVDNEWHFPNKWRTKDKWSKGWREDSGTARSIIKRAMAYGYFAGANVIELENPQYFLMDDLGEKPKLSKYGQDFEDVMQMSEQVARGFCFTPVAVLTSVYEPFSRSGGNGYGTDAFFFTLVPVLSEDGYRHRNEKKGEQGIMFNSEFGEIADVLTPDAAQKPGDFAAALAPYKWAFMMGTYDENDFERAVVEEWVKNGGTLVTSVDYVGGGHGVTALPDGGVVGRSPRDRRNLISADMAGVDFTTNIVTCGSQLIEVSTKRVCEGSMHQTFHRKHNNRDYKASLDYELHVGTPTTAKPFYADENGNVIAWENACGKGKVITITAVQAVPRIFTDRKKYYKELPIDNFFGIKPEIVAGRVTFPLQREILRKCQRETMPVEVEGDIQWGVNWVEQGGLRSCAAASVQLGGKRGCAGAQPSPTQPNNPTIKQSNNSPRWLVWLINNKGVKKFAYEDDDIDHAFDAKVKITNKKTGKIVEKTVPAGGYAWVEM